MTKETHAKNIADALFTMFSRLFQDKEGIHYETFLVAMGGLSGMACYKAAWEERADRLIEFHQDETRCYVEGDGINHFLFSGKQSLYQVAKRHLNIATDDEAVGLLSKDVLGKVSSTTYYDVTSLEEVEIQHSLPVFVGHYWPQLRQYFLVEDIDEADLIVSAFGLLISQIIQKGQPIRAAEDSLKIALEAAFLVAHAPVMESHQELKKQA